MTASETPEEDGSETGARKSPKVLVLLSVILCLIGLATGYFGVTNGLVPLPGQAESTPAKHEKPSDLPDVAFVPIPTLIVTLPPGADNDHLRFSGQIEVRAEFQKEIEFLMPRIQNFLNEYLRALSAQDIEGQGSLFRIRLQMFRRIVAIVGLGKVNNFLVTEFILN